MKMSGFYSYKRPIALGLSLILVSLQIQSANAGALCRGTIKEILTYDTGQVMIRPSWHSSWMQICSVETARDGVGVQTCWNWYAMASEAMSQGDNLLVYYASLDSAAGCADLPTYGASEAPRYLRREPAP